MKPKFRSILHKSLPSLFIIPAMSQMVHATVFTTDAAGNYTATSAQSGANSILASGGTSLTPTVTIDSGASLTGDLTPLIGQPDTLLVTAAGYTITNNGSLVSTTNAINTGLNSSTIVNNGTLTGGAFGILGTDATITNNSTGTINGLTGISVGGVVGSTINNSGTINGTIAGVADPVGVAINNAGAGPLVLNLNAGSTVTGGIIGLVGDTLNINAADVNGSVIIGTINKEGTGNAFIGGTVSDTPTIFTVTADVININNGGLIINGDVSGFTPGGATINITDGGIGAGQSLPLAPTDEIGTLNIVGNVNHTGNSSITYNARPQAVANVVGGIGGGLINHVGGTYDLGTSTLTQLPTQLRITPINSAQVLSDVNYTVLTSTAPIIGTLPTAAVEINGTVLPEAVLAKYFTTVALTPAAGPIPNNLNFTINHSYETLPGLSSSQASLGAAIDNSTQSGNANVQEFIAALDYSNLATVQEVLNAPARALSYAQALVTSNYLLHRTTQEHLAQVRGATTTSTVAASGGKGGMTTTETTSASSGNAWGSYSYDWLDSNSDYNNNASDGISSFTAGVDWRLAPNLLMGVVLDGTTGSDQDGFKGAVYGTWGESMGIYSDFLAGYGTHNLDSSDSFFGTNSPDADQFQALWTFGYTMGDREVKHGPFAGLEYQNVNLDRFDSGSLPVTLDSGDIDSLRGLIGYRVDTSYGRFSPYASVAYAHEFEDDNIDGTGSFDGNAFTVSGDSLGSAILLTAGTNYAFTDKLAMNIGYRGELSVESNGVDSNGGTIGLNYAF